MLEGCKRGKAKKVCSSCFGNSFGKQYSKDDTRRNRYVRERMLLQVVLVGEGWGTKQAMAALLRHKKIKKTELCNK